jgi:hypothetical protein
VSRRLDDLSPRMKPLAMAFLARLVEAKIAVLIVDTKRTPEEHARNLAGGRSWVKHSKHIDGDAMDVCPYDIYEIGGRNKLNWDATHPVWARIADIAESCGLVSGFRWAQKDCGHVEYPTEVKA